MAGGKPDVFVPTGHAIPFEELPKGYVFVDSDGSMFRKVGDHQVRDIGTGYRRSGVSSKSVCGLVWNPSWKKRKGGR